MILKLSTTLFWHKQDIKPKHIRIYILFKWNRTFTKKDQGLSFSKQKGESRIHLYLDYTWNIKKSKWISKDKII